MRIAILGFGREGKSLLKYLKRHPRYHGSKIDVLDQKQHTNSARSAKAPRNTNAPTRIFGNDYLKNLERFDLIFRSPGVPYNLPEIQRAIKRGVKFSSATKLFFDEVAKILRRGSLLRQGFGGQAGQVIGITGTKGKGTTAALLYKILKAAGFNVLLAGNIGKPAPDILPKIKKNSLVILELSSFQLQDLKKAPQIAVVTDVFPDHLDVHKNMREYVTAKANVAKHQRKTDVIFYFQDNLLSRVIAEKSPGAKIGLAGEPFGLKKNYLMASAVAAYLGCPGDKIYNVIKKFKDLEHRLELVKTIRVNPRLNPRRSASIRFYNDSAGTNPQTAAAAISSLTTRNSQLILIAGGKDKNLNYRPLADAIKKSGNVKQIILFGENKNKIKQVLSRAKVPAINARNLKSAVALAYKNSTKLVNSSTHQLITILLSPGAASFDMFKDYADRGKKFKNIVKNLK